MIEDSFEGKSSAELISEYAGLLWRWSWLLAILAIVSGGIAYYVSGRQPPVYQASTLVMINTAPASVVDSYGSYYTAQTYAQIMTTRPILDGVAKRLGVPILNDMAQVQSIQNTPLLRITVSAADPDLAALVANTLVLEFADQIRTDQSVRYAASKANLETQLARVDQQIQEATISLASLGTIDDTANLETIDDTTNQPERLRLETTLSQYRQSYASLLQSYEQIRLAEAQSTSTIVQKEAAVPPKAPIQPQPVRSAILAAVVGLMIGVGIIFLREFLDDTIRDPEEITRRWGIPILGMIIRFSSTDGNILITQKQPRSPVSEAFRSLRTNLQFASIDKPIRTLLITSPSPEDGKTTVVANLASVIAQNGKKTVVVDADLRRPRVHKLFDLDNRIGLTDEFINAEDHLNGSVQSTELENLHALTSGSLPPNPSELLGSEKMSEILNHLHKDFDVVILDTPPALVVTDADVLAPLVDGVLIVVRPSVSKRAGVKHVIEQLNQVKANIVGVVLNDVPITNSRYYYYRSYYQSRYGHSYHYKEYEDGPTEGMDVRTAMEEAKKRSTLRDLLSKSYKKKPDNS